MAQWKDLLIDIKDIEEKYGSSLRNSASDKEIIKLKETTQKKLGNIELPESYIEFLGIVNGLDSNGLVIYGIDKEQHDQEEVEDIHGMIETNEIWYENEWQKKYIFWRLRYGVVLL